MTTATDAITTTVVLPDGTKVPLDSEAAAEYISGVVRRAHGIPDNVDPDTGELFDPKPYQTPVPTLDGHRADTLKLAFGGAVEVDKMDNQALEHFKNLRFGQEIALHIVGTVGKNGWSIKTNSEGEETVSHTLGIVVHSYTVDGE